MAKIDARKETFECVGIFGKPALFTNGRVSRFTVPQGWFCYDLRGNDAGDPATIERYVAVNHAGTILSPTEIPFEKGGDTVKVDEAVDFIGVDLTLKEFCEDLHIAYPADTRKYAPRPASHSEAGLFYALKPELVREALDSREQQLVGRLTFANGDVLEFTNPAEYVEKLREEIDFISTTGMR